MTGTSSPPVISSPTEKIEAPYGTWQSPITSKLFTENCQRFMELRLDPTEKGKGIVYWSECRPSESGRTVICSRMTGGKILEWSPQGYDVRSRVHEYGGGAFFIYNGVLYFSNSKDSRWYKQEAFNVQPIPITESNNAYRYADGCFSNGFIYCIREDHTNGDIEAKNTIISIKVDTGVQTVVVEGADFYSCPSVSPDGMNLMWMQWNFPNMPWDDTEIQMANLNENGTIQAGTERTIAGSKGVNYMQPKFSPLGKSFYICDETDWWNLYEYFDSGNHHNVQPLNKDLGTGQWVFGMDAYSFDPKNSGDVAVAFGSELGIVNLKSELYYKQETGFSHHQYLNFGRDSCIYCIASGPTKFQSIIRWNVVTGETEVIKECRESLDDSLISVPEHITFRTGSGGAEGGAEQVAYGYYYPPKNPCFKPRPKTLPPLVVMVHGGPTSSCLPTLDLKKQYLTTRGFAVLDVNYRGSTGYGKKYRNLLNLKWGIFDVEDCCNGALHLVREQKVDPYQLAITGGSAGGYAVLACLTFTKVFKVGVSRYGVADLEALETGTHKFESKYNDRLVGPFPEQVQEYRRRSPIHAIDRLECPVAFFHGTEDKVVPPAQAQIMYDALLKKGIPTALVMFPGEQHGFHVAENIQLAVDGEFYFFCKIFGIPAKLPDNLIDIKNFDTWCGPYQPKV